MVTNSNCVLRVMVALDIWLLFLSESNTDLEIRKQQEIEHAIGYLEELAQQLAWQEFRQRFYIELCITDSSFETLSSKFNNKDAIKVFSNQVRRILSPENILEDTVDGINQEYQVTQSLRIPILLTNLNERISVTPFSSSPRILSPEELNTHFWLNETLPLRPTGVKRWLFSLLQIPPSSRTKDDYVNEVYHYIDNGQARTVCQASADMLLQVRQDLEFSQSLTDIDLLLPSGMSVIWILRLMGAASIERVTGRFLFESICARYKERKEKKKVYIVSDQQKSLDKISGYFKKSDYSGMEIVSRKCIDLKMVNDINQNQEIIETIRTSKANIVFVALPPSLQEQWIVTNGQEIDAVVISVGHLTPSIFVDGVSVPYWVEQAGFEWLWTLLYEPSHQLWRHYLTVVPTFIALGLKLQVLQTHRHYHPIAALPQRFSIIRLLYHITEFDTFTTESIIGG